MHTTFRQAVVAAGLAALTLTSACGKAESAGKHTSTTSATSGPAAKAKAAAKDAAAQFTEGEELIAACMKKKGWDYTPNPAPDFSEADVDPTQISEEQGNAHGYGIADSLASGGGSFTAGAGGSVVVGGGDDAPKDPNVDYVESLPTPERKQYFHDLLGISLDEQPDGPGEASGTMTLGGDDSSPAIGVKGCAGEAAEKIVPDADSMPTLTMNGEDDPKVAATVEKWAACMHEEGYSIASPSQAVSEVFNQVVKPKTQNQEGTPDQATIDSIRTAEIAIWKADHACQKSSGYAAALKKAQER